MKVVLVTGGRAYTERWRVRAVLDEERPDLIIHGGAATWDKANGYWTGTDHFAAEWADDYDVPQLKVPYLRKHGRSGGPIRNTAEVGFLIGFRLLGDTCTGVAFPGNTGTADTVTKLRRAAFSVREIEPQ